jgi:acetylornithine deacetylase
MKSFIAIALANADRFLSSDAPFAVHFAFSYEEEVGCFGVRELIADLRDAGIKPLACIVGEPTSMVPAIAHKGVYRYKCCVRGKEAHSSLTPQSVNAIEMAARLVGKVRDMAEGFEREEPRYEGFDVPFSTASVGQFHGGIADNVVPRDAEFRYEFRDLPTADAKRHAGAGDRLCPHARTGHEEGGARCRLQLRDHLRDSQLPGLGAGPGHAAGPAAGARTAHHAMVAFGTEAGLFKNAGIPTVVCGPGSIVQAHQPDEYVSLDQLARCESSYVSLALTRELR